MQLLCLQSMLASIVPCDLGLVGVPTFTWMRDSATWLRRVTFAGGARAVIAGALLLAPGSMKTRNALTTLVGAMIGTLFLTGSYAHAEPNRVKFPDLDKLVHYTTVKRGKVTEHIMTTPEAIAAVKQGRPAPSGTHFVLVDYREGKVHRYFVMQKEAGWGADYDARRQTGDWQFQWFWPDRSLNLSENTARCQSCHDGRKDNDYLYTAGRIAEFDKTPIE